MNCAIAYFLVALLVVFVSFEWWSEGKTANDEAFYLQYEVCVQKTYGMTPSSWYQEHGAFPPCV